MIKEHNNSSPGNPSHPQTPSSSSSSIRDAIHLPKYATVGSLNLAVDVIREDEMTEMYRMISQAMQSGDGYGVDEYQSEEEFLCDLNGGPTFAVTNSDTGKMVAGFALSHSKYYRGNEIRAVDPVIIVRKSNRGQGLGEFILETCLEFAKRLDYVGMYADTFTNNSAMMRIIEKRPAFEKVGTLPLGGRMPDGSVVGMNLYYMDLTTDNDNDNVLVAAD